MESLYKTDGQRYVAFNAAAPTPLTADLCIVLLYDRSHLRWRGVGKRVLLRQLGRLQQARYLDGLYDDMRSQSRRDLRWLFGH